MKKKILVGLCVVMAVLIVSLICNSSYAATNVTITFKDEVLYKEIIENLNWNDEYIISKDDNNLKLTVSQDAIDNETYFALGSTWDDEQITDLTGIEKFVNLMGISIYSEKITDISPIESLTKLEELYLGNYTESIGNTLEKIKTLKRLSIDPEITIGSLEKIIKLENLVELSIHVDNSTDIDKLTKLERLDLYIDEGDYSEISKLSNLVELNLDGWGQDIEFDMNVIASLTKLEWLQIINLNLNNKDITSVKNLTNLKRFFISNVEVNDISSLAYLQNLEELSLFEVGDKIDITPLKNLKKLKKLDVNTMDDETILKVLPNLESVNYRTVINSKNISVSGIENMVYTGNYVKPDVTIEDSRGYILTEGEDYTITYSNSKNIGKATATIKGTGWYTGTIIKTFYIVPAQVTKLKVTAQTQNTISLTWNKVSKATGYQIYQYNYKTEEYDLIRTIASNINTAKITGLAQGTTYKFKVKAYTTVNGIKIKGPKSDPVKTSTKTKTPVVTLVTTGSKNATIKWGKVSNATGYELYMATSKNGKYTKIKTLSGASTIKYTKTGLTKGKTYYFKVRTYRTVNGIRIYSSYSNIKAVKVK